MQKCNKNTGKKPAKTNTMNKLSFIEIILMRESAAVHDAENEIRSLIE